MKKIESNIIDLIFADPPYYMNLQNELIRVEGTKFDGVNDEWDKYNSLEEYDEECKKWLSECLRILKNNGSLWVIGSYHNIHRLGYLLQNLGAWIINEIVWEKTNPVPNFRGARFVNSQEILLWVTKNKTAKFTFNYKTMKHINGGKQMKSVWKIPICTGNERLKDEFGKKIHSTQKPLVLLERIILACSKPNDIVLDPFSGTGTSLHAAKLLGRKYIGIEKEQKYWEASIKRLENLKEDFSRDDLKNAIYDIKQKKIEFKELIDRGYVSVQDELKIKTTNLILHFNKNGTIKFEKQDLTPNQLCRRIFHKPTNAWNWIFINDKNGKSIPLSKYREMYLEKNEKE